MQISPWQIVVVVVIILILFGPKRLPGLGKSLGQALRDFKKALDGTDKKDSKVSKNEKSPHSSDHSS